MQLAGSAQITRIAPTPPAGPSAVALDRLLDRLEGPRPVLAAVPTAAQIERTLGAVDGRVRAVYAPV